jgi:hypothetical protein
MPQSNVSTWLAFALQQMAAESYLDGIALSDNDGIITRLKLGNNNPLLNDPEDPTLDGGKRTGTFYISERRETVGVR